MRRLLFIFVLCVSFQTNAALIIWEFEVEILEYEDQLALFPSLSEGDSFTGYFGYDSSIQQTNNSTYVNRFESDSLVFGLDFQTNINDFEWTETKVNLVHQGGRNIIDFLLELDTGDFDADVEIGFLDYSKPYQQGELPLNWHNLSSFATPIEFGFEASDDITGYSTEIYGEFTSISQRESIAVPEPAAWGLILPFMFFVFRKRLKH